MKWRRRQRSDRARPCKDCMGERGDKGARYADGKPLWSISGAPLFFQCAQNEATAQATAVRHRRHRRRCEVTSRALLVRLEAKPGMEAAVEDFLFSARKLVTQEAGTRAWFALRFGRSQYGIFDAFDDDAGRNAHLDGAVAAALHSQGSELFARAPIIERVEVLADKLPTASPAPPDTKGLLLTFPAKTGHAAQADQFARCPAVGARRTKDDVVVRPAHGKRRLRHLRRLPRQRRPLQPPDRPRTARAGHARAVATGRHAGHHAARCAGRAFQVPAGLGHWRPWIGINDLYYLHHYCKIL